MNRHYATLVKREFWEHRSLWIAPLVAAGFFVVAAICAVLFAGSHININGPVHFGPRGGGPMGENPVLLGMAALAAQIFLVSAITCFVYLLDCLYSERKDRSILFWKSLPVSDADTVLVKFAVGMVIVPIAVFILTMIAYGLIYGALSLGVPAFASFTSASTHASWWEGLTTMLGMLAASLLWYAPVGAWFMLVSVMSRRAPILMATMPFVALGIAESMLFRSNHVWQFIGYRLRPQTDLMGALAEPNLWMGLVAAAGMLYLVVRLRRYRDDT
jgi:ABC-2 type transport system permease protein